MNSGCKRTLVQVGGCRNGMVGGVHAREMIFFASQCSASRAFTILAVEPALLPSSSMLFLYIFYLP